MRWTKLRNWNDESLVLPALPRSIAILLVGLLLSACDPHLKWNEQVELQSGEVIVIKRTAKFSENWIAGGGGGSFNKGMTIEFSKPNKPDNPTIWSALYVPMVLDRDPETNEWFILATFFHCDSWYDLGRPRLPYTEYHFRNGKWVQLPLNEKWLRREANVLPADLSDRKIIEGSTSVLTIGEKKGIFSNQPGMSPRFRRIESDWPSRNGC